MILFAYENRINQSYLCFIIPSRQFKTNIWTALKYYTRLQVPNGLVIPTCLMHGGLRNAENRPQQPTWQKVTLARYSHPRARKGRRAIDLHQRIISHNPQKEAVHTLPKSERNP
jgi:hypothetical protein